MKTKKCNRCKQEKAVNLFTIQRYYSGTIGLSSDCKECKKIKMQEYRKTEQSLQKRKEHYQKNKERLIQISLKRREKEDYRFNYIFLGMKRRCTDIKSSNYKYYGERGIKVEWKSYQEFKDDMYKSYKEHAKLFGEKQTTIDRIDVNGNYCKKNCRWATWKEQSGNKRVI